MSRRASWPHGSAARSLLPRENPFRTIVPLPFVQKCACRFALSPILHRKEQEGNGEDEEAQDHHGGGISDHVPGLQSRDAEKLDLVVLRVDYPHEEGREGLHADGDGYVPGPKSAGYSGRGSVRRA